MKTKLFITFFVLSCILVGCKEPINPPTGGNSGYEAIQGNVVNEEGIALEGIMMAAYLDEQLTNPYLDKVKDWNASSDDYKKEHADREPIYLTDSEGYYSIGQACIHQEGTLDVFVEAIDPAGIYQTQVIKAQMVFKGVEQFDGSINVAGEAHVDFVLSKNEN